MATSKRAMKLETSRIERLLPIGLLLLSCISVPVMILSPTGYSRLQSLSVERKNLDEEISRVSQQIRQLREEVRRVKNDPAAVERVARDELGLVRQTEVVFQFAE